MKALHLILFVVAVGTISVSAHDLVGRELVHYELTNYVFAAEHGDIIESEVQSYFEKSDYTQEGFFKELVYLSECLKNDKSSTGALIRNRILGTLGKFSKEGAENYLKCVIATETGRSARDAIGGLLNTTSFSKASMHFLSRQLKEGKRDDILFRYSFLGTIDGNLEYSSLTQEQRSIILSTLKESLQNEVIAADWLDKILCRELPEYASSEERAATLKRIAESPEASEFVRGYMREALRKLGKAAKP